MCWVLLCQVVAQAKISWIQTTSVSRRHIYWWKSLNPDEFSLKNTTGLFWQGIESTDICFQMCEVKVGSGQKHKTSSEVKIPEKSAVQQRRVLTWCVFCRPSLDCLQKGLCEDFWKLKKHWAPLACHSQCPERPPHCTNAGQSEIHSMPSRTDLFSSFPLSPVNRVREVPVAYDVFVGVDETRRAQSPPPLIDVGERNAVISS